MKENCLVPNPVSEQKEKNRYVVKDQYWVKAGAALMLSVFEEMNGNKFYQIPFVKTDPLKGFSITRFRLEGEGAKELGLKIMDQRDKDQGDCHSCL